MPVPIDEAKLQQKMQMIGGWFAGMMQGGMVHVGDRLGLYAAMADGEPVTPEELAGRTGTHERWVREWLQAQAASGVIDYAGEGRFSLTPESAALLVGDTMMNMARLFEGIADRGRTFEVLPECFRTGIGLSWVDADEGRVRWMERQFGPWYREVLVPRVIPALDGVRERLTAGAKVADVGCGTGIALVTMAKAFPNSELHGFDIAPKALERARANAAAAGATNVTFHNVGEGDGIPGDGSFDLVTTFDCVHDMTDPEFVVRSIRAALGPDGVWFIADIDGRASFEQNLREMPGAGVMYSVSVAGCLASGLSEPGGAGLGTLGLPEPRMRELAETCGFTRFRRVPVPHPVNAYYEVRR